MQVVIIDSSLGYVMQALFDYTFSYCDDAPTLSAEIDRIKPSIASLGTGIGYDQALRDIGSKPNKETSQYRAEAIQNLVNICSQSIANRLQALGIETPKS